MSLINLEELCLDAHILGITTECYDKNNIEYYGISSGCTGEITPIPNNLKIRKILLWFDFLWDLENKQKNFRDVILSHKAFKLIKDKIISITCDETYITIMLNNS